MWGHSGNSLGDSLNADSKVLDYLLPFQYIQPILTLEFVIAIGNVCYNHYCHHILSVLSYNMQLPLIIMLVCYSSFVRGDSDNN